MKYYFANSQYLFISKPSTLILPFDGFKIPVNNSINVLLPDPDDPVIKVKVFLLIFKFKLLITSPLS